MNRLKQLAAVLLNPMGDSEQTHAALEAAGVPVSFADCRNCPDPCEDGKRALSFPSFDTLNRVHRTRGIPTKNRVDDRQDFPHVRFREALPPTGSVFCSASRACMSLSDNAAQVVISTGKSDWERSVTDEKGSLASYLSTIEKAAPVTIADSSTPGTAPSTPTTETSHLPPAVAGIFKDSETHTVSILNGSHDTLSKNHDHETVLVFPDYKVVTEVPRSLDGARELWRNSVNPSVSREGTSSGASTVKSWVIPYTCVILICESAVCTCSLLFSNPHRSQVRTEREMSDALLRRLSSSMVRFLFIFHLSVRRGHHRHANC